MPEVPRFHLAVPVTHLPLPGRSMFAGQVGEQATMFFRDPAGNALEVKSFRRDAQVFET